MAAAAPRSWFRFALLCVLGFSLATPFVWMAAASFKPRAEVESVHIVPQHATGRNYPIVLDVRPDPATGRFLGMQFGRWYGNSLLVAAGVTLLQVLTSAMAAYAFSRVAWRWRDRVFLLYLTTMMIPGVVTMIPNFQIMVGLRLINTYQGLIIPAAFSAFGTFMLRQFMLSIPPALDEAATIDGAGHWRIFTDIILPLARPGIISLGLLTFLGSYQSFFWPLVMLQDSQLFTLPVGMVQLDSSYGRQTELIMAATVMNIVPLIVIFVTLQKFLVKGLQLGGVKG